MKVLEKSRGRVEEQQIHQDGGREVRVSLITGWKNEARYYSQTNQPSHLISATGSIILIGHECLEL